MDILNIHNMPSERSAGVLVGEYGLAMPPPTTKAVYLDKNFDTIAAKIVP